MGQVDRNSLIADLVNWLIGIEERAALFYAEAAEVFAADVELNRFLTELAREEDRHHQLLRRALPCFARETLLQSCFWLDTEMKCKTEAPFVRARQLLSHRKLTKVELLGLIAEAEFSEWNDIFLYVIGLLKKCGREFEEAAAEMDCHRRDVEKLVLSLPEGEAILARSGRMPAVWKRRILVVEDEPTVAKLLQTLLSPEAEVVLAADGDEGLARLRESYFDVVVSDVEMPRTDGIEMYRQAIALNPELRHHFVFFTATRKPTYQSFFQQEQVVMLPKPSSLTHLRRVIVQVAEGVRPQALH